MDEAKSSATGTSGDAGQASAHSKSAVPRQQINVQMVQNIRLIWLDVNIDENNVDSRKTITQLRCAVNDINIFTDSTECVRFLDKIPDNKACMIISGSIGQYIVPRIHNMFQVDSIFIFCGNKKHHEQWVKDWPKIKGVFTQISPICEALKQAAQQCEQNAIPISFMGTSSDISKKNLDQLSPTFMYTQTLKEILLSIEFNEEHIKEFIDHCRAVFAENEFELKNIDEVQKKYHDKTPISWYTYKCFLSPMLNSALRIMDVDIIIKMSFFIGDLHRHIELLHSEQFGDHPSGNSFTVYRGQGMSKTDFDQMTKTKGGLMSFNNFLLTTKDHNASLGFACGALSNSDMVGILFVMTIDSVKSTTPFSFIDVSFHEDSENKVLFTMNTVFRIGEIKPMDENHRLFQVNLTLTGDNDKDFRLLINRIHEETFPHEKGWQRLGLLLNKMSQSEKSKQVFQILEQKTNEVEKGNTFEKLGKAKYEQREYEAALEFYEKSLEIRQQSLRPNHPSLAHSYNNIGAVYENMGEYPKALSFYEKVLEIKQQSLPPDHPDLVMSYNSIGIAYRNMSEYPEALSSYEKALEIQQQSLPPNHPDFISTYNNIGIVHRNMGEYRKTLLSYEKVLEIQQQSLSPNHPDLAMSCNNIGVAYANMGNYSKACSFYERAVKIGQHSLPSNDTNLEQWIQNLKKVKKKL